jgi:hypothetical protein
MILGVSLGWPALSKKTDKSRVVHIKALISPPSKT